MTPERVGDRLALLELVARYAHTVDARNVDGIVACFTSDARLEFVSDATVLVGHDAIGTFYREAFLRPALASGASTHLMTNSIIGFDGQLQAHIVTQAIAYLAPSGTGSIAVRGLTYTDSCHLGANGWRLAQRVHRLMWEGALPGGPAGTAVA